MTEKGLGSCDSWVVILSWFCVFLRIKVKGGKNVECFPSEKIYCFPLTTFWWFDAKYEKLLFTYFFAVCISKMSNENELKWKCLSWPLKWKKKLLNYAKHFWTEWQVPVPKSPYPLRFFLINYEGSMICKTSGSLRHLPYLCFLV